MRGPNEVLPCPSPSARRRHAARGRQCRTCEAATRSPDELAQVRLVRENHTLRARLADVERTLKGLLASPVIPVEALEQAHRRLFCTTASKRRAS